jgi:hypothetical protein
MTFLEIYLARQILPDAGLQSLNKNSSYLNRLQKCHKELALQPDSIFEDRSKQSKNHKYHVRNTAIRIYIVRALRCHRRNRGMRESPELGNVPPDIKG